MASIASIDHPVELVVNVSYLVRFALFFVSLLFDPLDYGAAFQCGCFKNASSIIGVLSVSPVFFAILDIFLFHRFLGPRGGKGLLAWTLPLEGVLQLILTVVLYLAAVRSVDPQDETIHLAKLHKHAAVILVSSLLGFLTSTVAFWYFHLFRMSQVPTAYEPACQTAQEVDSDTVSLQGSEVDEGALSVAFRLHGFHGISTSPVLSGENDMTRENTVASQVNFLYLESNGSY